MKRKKAVCMYTPESEQQLMKRIASSQHLPLSELVRRCTFTEYKDKSAKIRGDDCLDFLNAAGNIAKHIDQFCSLLDEGMYATQRNELIERANAIQEQSKIVYRNLDKMRARIRKYATKKMLDSQVAFAEVEGMKGSRVGNSILLTEEEISTLKKTSEEQGKSMSEILRMNVLKSCLAKEIVIDSYPLDDATAEINKSIRAVQAIIMSVTENGLDEGDIDNVLYFAENVLSIMRNIVILKEQKDTRREANRIVERQ